MKKVLIVAPPYSESSAGIVCLHELCDGLVRLGYESYIILLNASKGTFHYSDDPAIYSPKLQRSQFGGKNADAVINEILAQGIVIYPEIVTENPLNAKNVVRYYLNTDGAITGKKVQQNTNEYILAYTAPFHENPHGILFKPISSALLNTQNAPPFSQRSLDLTFIGKGSKFQPCFVIENTLELTGSYPRAKDQYALLLKHTRYLYSWDNVTSINIDAIKCGAKVVLLIDEPFPRNELSIRFNELGRIPFITGQVQDNRVILAEPENYDQIRTEYLHRLESKAQNWTVEIEQEMKKIFAFFKLA